MSSSAQSYRVCVGDYELLRQVILILVDGEAEAKILEVEA